MFKVHAFNAAKYRRRLQTTSMTRSRPMIPLLSERLAISRAPREWQGYRMFKSMSTRKPSSQAARLSLPRNEVFVSG